MCGIVGYVGKNNAVLKLIKGLKNLEYRGYDSAGIAIYNKNIEVVKEKGRISHLEEEIPANLVGNVGIAHTRWATHGVPSKINAHPHLDNHKRFAVVHNGIIENYLEIKNFLEQKGYNFISDTDTEVIPVLLDYYYELHHDVLIAFQKMLKKIKGSYAILVLALDLPNTILVAKNHSPMVIGLGYDGIYVASDIPAILEYTKDFYFLVDGESAVITDKIVFYSKDFEKIKKTSKKIDWEMDETSKNGYEDYMLKEIHEQPSALIQTLNGIICKDKPISFVNFKIDKKYLESLRQIYIVACGTAMHAGLVGKYAMENLVRIPVSVVVASEFRYQNPIIDNNTLCLFISQSGETADTIAAVKLAKKMGARTIAITNVFESSITREADDTIYTHAGFEIAVASTKAYISQVGIVVALALYMAETLNGLKYEALKTELMDLPKFMSDVISNENVYHKLALEMKDEEHLFYIGRGNDYNIALEGSLKLKEISYIHSEAYPAGELKHGPIALIDKGTYVVGIITDDKIALKTLSNLEEVKSRGANIILVTNQKLKEENVFIIPKISSILSPILAIIPLQLLAYFIAKEKGLDVDKPRNLAKSVTVE